MTTLILIFLGLIIVGLLIKVLGKSAGDEGAEALGGLLSGCGQMGCGCMFWIVVIGIGIAVLIVFAMMQGSQ
jgi:hypothetical protein